VQPLLFDRGLPPAVADALVALGLTAHAVGRGGAPPENSPDEENCKWCMAHGAVLVTNDRGKKDRIILKALAEHRVSAIFVYNDLRSGPAHELAKAVLAAEKRMDELVGSGKLIHHRLRPSGGLENRLQPRRK
jgi:hypothetical protein